MVFRGCGMSRAALLAAAAMVLPAPLQAQELDPDAPLEPMPELGVDWPDMAVPDPVPEPLPGEATGAPESDVAALEDSVAARRYVVRVEGLGGAGTEELVKQFDDRSALKADDEDPANAAQVDRRARADAELLTSLLQSQGYYDAEVETAIALEGERIAVTLRATPGDRYTFEAVELPGLAEAGGDAVTLQASYGVKRGDPVVAERVIAAGVALQVKLGEEGFATATIGEQDIVVNHETKTAKLVMPVKPGPVAYFGAITVSGQPPFSAKHLGVIARFRQGDRFEQSEVDDLRRALIATGLVASAETRLMPRDGGRIVDVDVRLEPAPMRTIAGELGYGTGEGIRAEASWQHRNFFNPEGALTLRGVAGTQEQLAAVAFRRNNFRRRDQVLNAQLSASHVERDAFEARTFQILGGIERQSNFIWQKKWTWSAGIELLATEERDTIRATGEERERTFLIAALPGSLNYDGSDDLLNPTRGFRLGGRISPELSFQGGTFGYTRAQVDASAYVPLSERIVGAGRLRLGTILGAQRDDIAPSRRFYAGGGGSVRGYGYQRIGPRDADNDPVGGRSLAEFSLEARIGLSAFGGNFGIVPFLDGGSLTTSSLPSMKHWQFGAGIGLRYYSSFGPIRLDVGTPLNRQDGDSRVAVTVSLGQAF
jgi:translocation and assembly module TamA